jgi:hypothetical protein
MPISVEFRLKLIGHLNGPFHANNMAQTPYDVSSMFVAVFPWSGESLKTGGRRGGLIVYYFAWKYLVGFLNRVVELA